MTSTAETRQEWVTVGEFDSLPLNDPQPVDIEEHSLLLVRTGDDVHAVANLCPHQGRRMDNATYADGLLECPHHGWQFPVGDAADASTVSLKKLQHAKTRVSDGRVQVRIRRSDPEDGDGIIRYLVRFARPGWVQVFGSLESLSCQRLDWLVVQTERGQELGQVLGKSDGTGAFRLADRTTKPAGEVLRLATANEVTPTNESSSVVEEVIARAEQMTLPVAIVDSELLFDQQTVVLYFAGEDSISLGPAAVKLAIGLTARVVFQPIHEMPEDAGAGGCGCSGGGCGS